MTSFAQTDCNNHQGSDTEVANFGQCDKNSQTLIKAQSSIFRTPLGEGMLLFSSGANSRMLSQGGHSDIKSKFENEPGEP